MNTEKMLADYGNKKKKLTAQAIPLFSKYGKADDNHMIAEMIAAKLQDFKPSIMFYGIYNAGKSSIIRYHDRYSCTVSLCNHVNRKPA